MDNIAEKVKDIFVRSFHLDPGEITQEAGLKADLDMDSTEIVELVTDLEKEFSIKIEDREITTQHNVGDVIEIVKGKL